MKDLFLNVAFLVHVELHDTGAFPESDAEKMVDRIQKAIEQDPRCEMLISKKGEGGFMHRILYQERVKDGST